MFDFTPLWRRRYVGLWRAWTEPEPVQLELFPETLDFLTAPDLSLRDESGETGDWNRFAEREYWEYGEPWQSKFEHNAEVCPYCVQKKL